MKALAAIVMLFLSLAAGAQQAGTRRDSATLVKTIGTGLSGFAVDNLGYAYLLYTNGQVKKLSPQGDSIAVFNDLRRFGSLYSVDVSNPLKVLLFYKDFGTVVVLDRFLNIRNTIDLRKLNIFQAKSVAQAFDNGIWVYDELDGKLKRLDDQGTVVGETVDFRVLFDQAPSPLTIADADRLVYLYDPEMGLYVLDYFGTLRNKVALAGWKDVQVVGNRVIGRKGTMLESYTPGTLDLKEQQMGDLLKDVSRMQLTRDHLYLLRNGVLHIYFLPNQ